MTRQGQAGVSAPHAKVEQRHLDIARSSLYGVMGYLGISVMTDEAVASVASRIADWEALATAPPEQAATRDSLLLTARCTWINDITYMKRIPGTPRTEVPCLNEGYAAIFDSGFPREVLCKHHYDGKVYRKEDVSGYRLLSEPAQPQPASGGALSEKLSLEICHWCSEHQKNGYAFVPYQDTDAVPSDAWQVSAAMGQGRDWKHVLKSENGCEHNKKCDAWMLWALVYSESLAAHDQKVRAEVRDATLREVKKIYDDGAVSATVYSWLRSQLGLSVGASPAEEKP